MPTINISEALQEAYASARTDAVEYYTFEFTHPDWSEPARLVYGWEEITAKMESTYLLDVLDDDSGDPSPSVVFYPIPIEFQLPPTVADEVPSFQFSFYDPSRIVMEKIFATQSGTPKPIKMYMRVFLSNRLEIGPETVPVPRFYVGNVQISAQTSQITGRCVFQDYMGRSAPFRTYTLEEFPGLRRR